MIGPQPDPREQIIANLDQQIDKFFGGGKKAAPADSFTPKARPLRSDKIDPDTILKRRRPSPTHAERIALRRATEAL